MNSTVTQSPQDQLATSIVTTASAIISALGIILVAYLQKKLGANVQAHHSNVQQRVDHIHEAIKSSQSNQGNNSPITRSDPAFCNQCLALNRD